MSKVPQHLIDEAAKRGIVPGALVTNRCMKQYRGGEAWVVGSVNEWRLQGRHVDDNSSNGRAASYAWIYGPEDNEWATVITPAPASEAEGLKEGDACEPDDHMRKAIVDKAKELGYCAMDGYQHGKPLLWYGDRLRYASGGPRCETISKTLSACAFYERLCVTAAPPKREMICGHWIKPSKGAVDIDGTVYSNTFIRNVSEKLID